MIGAISVGIGTISVGMGTISVVIVQNGCENEEMVRSAGMDTRAVASASNDTPNQPAALERAREKV